MRVSAPPPRTAEVGRYELYRTQDAMAAASGDFRRMRLVASRAVTTADWLPWTWFDDDYEWTTGPDGARTKQVRTRMTLELTDPNPPPGSVSYCVVARAAGPAGDQGRSLPSAAVRVAGL